MYPALIGTGQFSLSFLRFSAPFADQLSGSTPLAKSPLRALDRQRHALPDADAHRRQAALAARLRHVVRRGQSEASAGHAERMAERDRAAVRIDVLGIVRKPELAQARERLRGERFVQ